MTKTAPPSGTTGCSHTGSCRCTSRPSGSRPIRPASSASSGWRSSRDHAGRRCPLPRCRLTSVLPPLRRRRPRSRPAARPRGPTSAEPSNETRSSRVLRGVAVQTPRKRPVGLPGRAIMYRMIPGGAANLMAQMRRGSIEFCVLALLRDEERYGLDLSRRLAADGLVTSEGTMYPLLARLRQDGLVETSWHESSQGPPRRYYRLTNEGRAALDAFTVQWPRFRDAIDNVLDGGRAS